MIRYKISFRKLVTNVSVTGFLVTRDFVNFHNPFTIFTVNNFLVYIFVSFDACELAFIDHTPLDFSAF